MSSAPKVHRVLWRPLPKTPAPEELQADLEDCNAIKKCGGGVRLFGGRNVFSPETNSVAP